MPLCLFNPVPSVSSTMPYPPVERGFTLLEVLVSMVIVAVILVGSLQVISTSSKTAGDLNDHAVATWVAHNQLAKVQLGLVTVAVGEQSGQVEMGLRQWVWSMTTEATRADELLKVTVQVQRLNVPANPVTYETFILPAGT